MSWFRIEGKMPQHAKYAPLSDSAFRLAITAGAWCADHMTDGLLPKAMVSALTRAPRGKALEVTVASLVDAKIWEDKTGSWLIHDFLDWNLSREDWEKKVKAAKAGGAAKAAKSPKQQKSSVPHGKPNGRQVASHLPAGCSAITLPSPLPDSDSDSEERRDPEEIPPKPPRGGGTTKRAKVDLTPAPEMLEPTDATLAASKESGRDWRTDWIACRDWAWGKGERKADWQATLRGWMRRASGGGARAAPEKWGPGGGNGPQPNDPNNRYVPPRVIE